MARFRVTTRAWTTPGLEATIAICSLMEKPGGGHQVITLPAWLWVPLLLWFNNYVRLKVEKILQKDWGPTKGMASGTFRWKDFLNPVKVLKMRIKWIAAVYLGGVVEISEDALNDLRLADGKLWVFVQGMTSPQYTLDWRRQLVTMQRRKDGALVLIEGNAADTFVPVVGSGWIQFDMLERVIDDLPTYGKVVVREGVRIRREPTVYSDILGAVPVNQNVVVEDLVQYGDTWIRTPDGWMAAVYQGKTLIKLSF